MSNLDMQNGLIIPVRFTRSSDPVSSGAIEILNVYGKAIWDAKLSLIVSPVVFLTRPSILPDEDFIEPVLKILSSYPNLDCLIFDFDGVSARSEPLDVRVASAMALAIPKLRSNGKKIAISVAIGTLPDFRDTVWSLLKHNVLAAENSAILDYSSGSVISETIPESRFSKAVVKLRTLCHAARVSNEEKLSQRLVCHPGVYKFTDYSDPIFDFYDGSFCGDTVYIAVTDIIRNQAKEEEGLNVLFDDSGSEWFHLGVANAMIEFDHNVTVYPLSAFDETLSSKPKIDIFIVPVIRTGETLSNFFSQLEEAGYSEFPTVYTIIYANSEIDSFGLKTHNIRVENGESYRKLQFRSFVQRGRRGRRLSRVFMPLDLPELSTQEILSLEQIPSEAMWGMIFEVGLKEIETEVPTDIRGAAKWVPDFEEMIRKNGAYIASKLRLHCGQKIEESPLDIDKRNFYFALPDEPAMRKLADYLRILYNRDCVVLFDSVLIRLCTNTSSLKGLHDAFDRNESWDDVEKKRVGNLLQEMFGPERAVDSDVSLRHVIVLNEFTITGSTLEGMQNLVRMLHWDLIAKVSLARRPCVAHALPDVSCEADHYLYEFS